MKGNINSLLVVNQKNKGLSGVGVASSHNRVVSCKRLRNEGLHTSLGMGGYCVIFWGRTFQVCTP